MKKEYSIEYGKHTHIVYHVVLYLTTDAQGIGKRMRYVFLGPSAIDPVMKPILTKLENNLSLSREDTRVLESEYGAKYTQTLGLLGKENIVYIDCVIYPDDSVMEVHAKIGRAARLSHEDFDQLYLWTRNKIDEKMFKQHFVKHFTENDGFVKTYGTLLAALSNVTGKSSKQLISSMFPKVDPTNWTTSNIQKKLSADAINSLVTSIKLGKLIDKPINFKLSHKDGSEVFYPINPVQIDHTSEYNPFYFANELHNAHDLLFDVLLETFVPYHDTIYAVSKKTLDGLRDAYKQLYFPSTFMNPLGKLYIENVESKTGLVSRLREKSKQIRAKFDKTYSVQSHVQTLYIRNTDSKLNDVLKQVSIDALFHRYVPDIETPFITFASKSDSLYKLSKMSIAQGIVTSNDLEKWTNTDSVTGRVLQRYKPKQSGRDKLVIRIFLGVNKFKQAMFATLDVFPDCVYDLKLGFKSRELVEADYLRDVVKVKVDRLIDRLNDYLTVENVHLRYLDDKMLDISLDNTGCNRDGCVRGYGSLTLLTTNVITKKKNAQNLTRDQLKSAILLMSPLFEIERIEGNTMTIIYKRTNHFLSLEKMRMYVSKYDKLDLPKAHRIQMLARFFNLDVKTAESIFVSYTKNEFQKMSAIDSTTKYTTITFTMQQNAYSIGIRDVQHPEHNARILDMFKLLVFDPYFVLESNSNLKRELIMSPAGTEKNLSNLSMFMKSGININNLNNTIDIDEDYDFGFMDEDFEEDLHQSNNGADVPVNTLFGKSSTKTSKNGSPKEYSTDICLPTGVIVNEKVEGLPFTPKPRALELEEMAALSKLEEKLANDGQKMYKPLTDLQNRDSILFGNKSKFATKCQTAQLRQPIVMDAEDLIRNKEKYPGSIPNWIAYGSSKELEKNVYACPDVWCPTSKVAMTRVQFEDAGKRCPQEGELPSVNYLGDYWTKLSNDKKTVIGKKRGYINMYAHPLKEQYGDLCIPCCFTIKPTKVASKCNKIKVIESKDMENVAKSGLIDEHTSNQLSDTQLGTENNELKKDTRKTEIEKYIIKELSDLPENRLGFLPRSVLQLLTDKDYSYSIEEERHLKKGMSTFLRVGLSTSETKQFFLNCMVYVMDNPLIKSPADIVIRFVNYFRMDEFLYTQGGMLCKQFVNRQRDKDLIYNQTEFSQFKSWFTSPLQKDYIKKFSLQTMYDKLKSLPSYDDDHSILREFILYKGFSNFLVYMTDDDAIKTHDFLLDLFARPISWLNSRGYNIIIFEVTDDDKIQFSCPIHGWLENLYTSRRPHIYVLKRRGVYEPILRVKMHNSKMITDVKISSDPYTKRLIHTLDVSCKYQQENDLFDDRAFIDIITTELMGKIKHQVIDYNLQLVGYVIEKDLYVPLRYPTFLRNKLWQTTGCMFIDTMFATINPMFDIEYAKSVLLELNKSMVKQYYAILNKTDKLVYVLFEDQFVQSSVRFLKQVIPLQSGVQHEIDPVYGYADDLSIFVRAQSSDPRVSMVDLSNAYHNLYVAMKNEIISLIWSKQASPKQESPHTTPGDTEKNSLTNINNTLSTSIDFYRHRDNPIPRDMKRKLFFDELNTHVNDIFHINDTASDLFKGEFGNNGMCSIIADKTQCYRQCKWVDAGNRSHLCKLHVPRELYKSFMARIIDDLLDITRPIKRVSVKRNVIVNDDISLFSKLDVEEGKLDTIVQHALSRNTSQMGIHSKVINLDVEAFLSVSLADGKSESFQKFLPDKNERKEQNEQKDKIPFGWSKILPDFRKVTNETYNTMTLYELFSMLYNNFIKEVDDLAKMSPTRLRNKIIEKIANEFQANPDKTKATFAEASSLFKGNNIADYIQWANSKRGYPSYVELELIGRYFEVSIITIRRNSETVHMNIMVVYKSTSNYIVMLNQAPLTAYKKTFAYELIHRNRLALFHKHDLPKEFQKVLRTLGL